MTPAMCRVKHDPPHSYGDCLRACIATVLDLDTEQVPHFADMAATADEALASARRWLASRHLSVACFAFPGTEALADVLTYMGERNPGVTWLLFGNTGVDANGGDHVNVCVGGEVVHDPAWIRSSIKSPTSVGVWQIWVLCRI